MPSSPAETDPRFGLPAVEMVTRACQRAVRLQFAVAATHMDVPAVRTEHVLTVADFEIPGTAKPPDRPSAAGRSTTGPECLLAIASGIEAHVPAVCTEPAVRDESAVLLRPVVRNKFPASFKNPDVPVGPSFEVRVRSRRRFGWWRWPWPATQPRKPDLQFRNPVFQLGLPGQRCLELRVVPWCLPGAPLRHRAPEREGDPARLQHVPGGKRTGHGEQDGKSNNHEWVRASGIPDPAFHVIFPLACANQGRIMTSQKERCPVRVSVPGVYRRQHVSVQPIYLLYRLVDLNCVPSTLIADHCATYMPCRVICPASQPVDPERRISAVRLAGIPFSESAGHARVPLPETDLIAFPYNRSRAAMTEDIRGVARFPRYPNPSRPARTALFSPTARSGCPNPVRGSQQEEEADVAGLWRRCIHLRRTRGPASRDRRQGAEPLPLRER